MRIGDHRNLSVFCCLQYHSYKFEIPLPAIIEEFSAACNHRSRIKTEEKAKVIASVYGEEFIKFLVALYCFA